MENITNQKIMIVGLGLMGGSYARVLKGLGCDVSAITRSESTIQYALENGIIDRGYTYPDPEALAESDVVIFSLYPSVFIDWIEKYQDLLKPGAILTDVTGVKTNVVYQIQDMLRPDVEFISAHPMAGREVYGVQNSTADLFKNANFIVVPTEQNTPEAIEWCENLGRVLGCKKISTLSPSEHDRMIGFVSQLTHCIAVALMTCNNNGNLADYTGDSFRDLTRIARINDEMWSELFLLNKDALLEEMDTFIDEFQTLREMIASDDREGLREKMRLSTERRKEFDKK